MFPFLVPMLDWADFEKTIKTIISEIVAEEDVTVESATLQGEVLTVTFSDGDVISAHPTADDRFDAQTGMAMILAKKFAGSRSAFKRLVENIQVKA